MWLGAVQLMFLLQESRHVQQIQLKLAPVQLNYSPDGKSILYTTTNKVLGSLTFGREGEETKDQWRVADMSRVSHLASTVRGSHD